VVTELADISEAVPFLASDASRYLTGLQLKADGRPARRLRPAASG
jgi:NAD(P)-dependent dehydrogenase (short-subunit alcohol dehydrogenase family)